VLYLLRKFPEGVVFHGDDRTKGRKYQTGIEMDFRQSIGWWKEVHFPSYSGGRVKIQSFPKWGSVFGEFLQGEQGLILNRLNVVNDIFFFHFSENESCKDNKQPEGGTDANDSHQERHPEAILM
jgi:hypothetical protein